MKRNAYFDNAKIILIFLVVFGHMIQPFRDDHAMVGTLYTWMYTFHMPAFILIAGFFAKGSGKMDYIIKLGKRLLIPYLIFQAIYSIYYFYIGKDGWLTESIFYPHWSLWFLMSLFCWHLLLILFRKIPPVLGISIAFLFGVIIGYFDQVGHTFSLSRTFVFFPYFLLGYWMSKQQIMQLGRKGVKMVSGIVLVAAAVIIYYAPDIHTGWLLASKPYTDLGAPLFGSFARMSVYMTSIIMVTSVLAWIPSKRFSFTSLGARTLYVYLLHGFFIQLFRQWGMFRADNIIDLLSLAFITLVIVFILSSRTVIMIWQPLIEGSVSAFRKAMRSKKEGINEG